MNTELQNKAWSALPKEFKEEVNEIYLNAVVHHPCGYKHKTDLLKYLFGHHNLTSDAKGEDNLQERLWNMLSPRLQTYCFNMGHTSHDGNVEDVLEHLFGSKCLPDEDAHEDNFATKEPIIDDKEKESFTYPKFRVGDIVLFNDNIHRIIGADRENKEYQLERIYDNHLMGWIEEDEISLYKELKPAELKIFSKEHRLNIAAMAMQSLLSNPYGFIIGGKEQDKTPENIAKAAFLCADALIAKSML